MGSPRWGKCASGPRHSSKDGRGKRTPASKVEPWLCYALPFYPKQPRVCSNACGGTIGFRIKTETHLLGIGVVPCWRNSRNSVLSPTLLLASRDVKHVQLHCATDWHKTGLP